MWGYPTTLVGQVVKAVKGFDRFDLRSLQLVITNKTNVRRAASPASPRGATATPPAHASQSGDAGGLPSVAAQSRCRCGRGESGLSADVAGVSPGPGADVAASAAARRSFKTQS